MLREVRKRFPLSAAGPALALVMSVGLAYAQSILQAVPNGNQDLAAAARQIAPQPADSIVESLSPGTADKPELRFRTPQAADDTQLKQIIVFGRHSVRAPVAPNTYLNQYSETPFPQFKFANGSPIPPGILTNNGATLETILGGYYRLWLTKEGLLTGNDPADANFVYFRANVIERTIDSAKAFWAGLLPAAPEKVQFLTPSTASDPLFDPVGAGVARLDSEKAIAAVMGRLGGDPQSLASAYGAELALTRSILFCYPATGTTAPATPAGRTDVTAIPFAVSAGTSGAPVDLGGLTAVGLAIDPFVMEYADGMPDSEVGWGQVTAEGVSQTSRLYGLALDLEYRTPYLAKAASSNLAAHVVRSLVQAATGNPMTGALGNPSTKAIVLIASDVNLSALAGVFNLDWIVPGYQANYCGPGGALVFELRQSQSTGEYLVRASYVAQTLDQLRHRAALTLEIPPASAPLFIPGCSIPNATLDCPLANFVKVANRAIDWRSADLSN